MTAKARFIRFTLFFIVYLSINFLIAKLRSSDSIYENLLEVLRSPKTNVKKNEFVIVREISDTKNNFAIEENSFSNIEKEVT